MKPTIKDKVLSVLLEQKAFVSGESLSETLEVSRTSIWKGINKLRSEGYLIESVNNKGYRLVQNPRDIVQSLLSHDLKSRGIDEVQVFDTLDSTNLEAKRQALDIKSNALFISREQTFGRGRRGKEWVSHKDSGVYMSLLLRPDILPQSASMLTLLTGLAVCKSIEDLYKLNIKIKWPNDIVINGKKLCGILTEMSTEMDYVNYVVIGIGLNLYQTEFPKEVAMVATSLVESLKEYEDHTNQWVSGNSFSTHELIVLMIDYLLAYVFQFQKKGNIAFIKDEYEKRCVNMSGDLNIETAGGSYIAKGQGITDTGELVVMKSDGTLMEVNSGEVSVRGIYGYV